MYSECLMTVENIGLGGFVVLSVKECQRKQSLPQNYLEYK